MSLRMLLRLVPALVIVALSTGLVRAADPVPSLSSIPEDAAFYSSSLRLGEQMHRLLKSKAFATLRDLPAVKHALQHLHEEMEKPDSPLAHIAKAAHDPANKELMELVHDAVHEEIFVFGGANWAPFTKLLMEINSANQFAPAMAAIQGGNAQFAQFHALVKTLNAAGDRLQFPDTVIGFRIAKPDAAARQIARLESHLQKALANSPLKGRIKHAPVAGADALILDLDGTLVPWDKITADLDEESATEMKALVPKLKALRLSVGLLVKGDYLLLGMGPSLSSANAFGKGPSLATRSELKPLAQHADKPLIGVAYISAAVARAAATTPEDIDGLVTVAKDALDKAPFGDERKKAIEKDLRQLAKEISSTLPKPAAMFSCSFLTPRGQESYSYDFGPAPAVPGQTLTLAEHVGGSPLVAVLGVTGDPAPAYQWIVRWLKVLYGHGGAIVKEMFGDDAHTQFQGGMDMVRPFLERFDAITSKTLLPALGGGELAAAIDNKWSSANWYKDLNQGGQALPMLEIGLVRSVQNSAQVMQALHDYRELLNDILAKAREFGAPIPEGGIPAAESKTIGSATVYFWPIPPIGLDEQVLPNLGTAKNLVAKSLSLKQTERLLASNPLTTQGGLLETNRPLHSAAVADFAKFIGTVRPWLEKFALPALLEQIPENAPPGLKRDEIPPQVRKVLDVLQCLRGFRSVSYRDADANVTRTETVVEDLK